ncbi:putative enzyme related to lactoylglutathione lyase [Mesorhizobium sangaii]|uniref:Putative enzyme related to lactoylglutathione lyase n=1 Tax=Mesorhizobium sangaii TaxID=505389 RepID=A0A841PR70_9HYPH|nr:putative enzyme related to lactoylglutathione lyase [Mesorhizobium sangaii]
MASIAAKTSGWFEIPGTDIDRARVFYGRGRAEW